LTPGERKLVTRPGHNSLLELIVIVVVAIGLALLIQAFLVKPYRIPSESMEPTLDVGQRVLVSRFNYKFSDPDRGDIVVFHPPAGADSNTCGVPDKPEDEACPRPTPKRDNVNFIKRIVAIPGDTLAIQDGHPVVNGKQKKENFILPCAPGTCNFPRSIKIPPGYFFMMGDNRGQSDDSRFWGPVPKKWIIGQAFSTYWPPRRIGIL
jgi:signal peptidase I